MEYFQKANEAFVDENYDEALKLYTAAIENDSTVVEYFVKRAQTYIKLAKYAEAEGDAGQARSLDPSSPKACLRQGVAQFHLEKYKDALASFQTGSQLDKADANFSQWIEKCKAKIPDDPEPTKQETAAETKQDTQPPAASIPQPPKEKQRYDWYQTESHVIITIMIKGCKRETVDINYNQHTFSATIKLPTGSDYSLELDLAHPVVPTHCVTRILSSKVECKLKKEEGIRWNKLEGDDSLAAASSVSKDDTHKHPTSSHYSRNWDKIAKEAEEEDKQDGVNDLFQKIYADGSDEVRKAMNKSFVESGGTVLSTNWKEIADKKTEMKPPDGMEWKNYET
ncbi:protein SGT1 homolog [Apostichopus japonicus]|uniref:protein SGT1 homolog n=1 Tax=Stichopus japonicus TaxID=307972 RepID=UPI003AB6D38E